MKKNISLLIILFSLSAHAQTMFQKVSGDTTEERAYSLTPCSDGGFLIAGYRDTSAGYFDAYLVRTDNLGDTLWTRSFGGASYEDAEFASQVSDGGFIAVGTTQSFSTSNDIYVMRTDSNGNLVWSKTYGTTGNEQCFAASLTSDGGLIITGTTGGITTGNILVMKTDMAGNLQWTKSINGANNDQGYSVKQTSDGGYIIGGGTTSYGAGIWDAILIKLSSGNIQWVTTYGGTDSESAYSVCQTSDGGYIIAGYTGSFGATICDVYLIKTDSNGNLQWSKMYGGANYEQGYSIQQTSDGGYIIAGITLSFSFPPSGYLLKTDTAGNLLWSKAFTSAIQFSGTRASVLQTADGGFAMTTSAMSTSGSEDIYFIKTDTSGNSGCNIQNPPTVVTPVNTIKTVVTILSTSPIIVTGTPATVTGSGEEFITLCIITSSHTATHDAQSAIIISPNPATSQLIIDNVELKIKLVEIYDVLGEKVYTETISGTQKEINIKTLTAGIYFVKVRTEKEERVAKFVKQ